MLLHVAPTHAADACCYAASERSTEGETGGCSVPAAAPAIPDCFRPAAAASISRAPATKRKLGHNQMAAMAKAKADAAARELPQPDLPAGQCLAAWDHMDCLCLVADLCTVCCSSYYLSIASQHQLWSSDTVL